MSQTKTARRTGRPAPSSAKGRAPQSPARSRTTAVAAKKRRFPLALVVGIALAVGLVAVIVLTIGAGGNDGSPLEVGTPIVTGEALAPFTSSTGDPAVGLPIPEVVGADFDGTAVSITRDGRAKLILFIAHWCSVCQQEVPLIAAWLPEASIPDNVDLYTVSTGVRRDQANYPPSRWLADEGWTLPLIMDDEARSVAEAFGLGAYPYWVLVDAEGNVFRRATGGMSVEALSELLTELSEA